MSEVKDGCVHLSLTDKGLWEKTPREIVWIITTEFLETINRAAISWKPPFRFAATIFLNPSLYAMLCSKKIDDNLRGEPLEFDGYVSILCYLKCIWFSDIKPERNPNVKLGDGHE